MQVKWIDPANYFTGDPSLQVSYPVVGQPCTVVALKTGQPPGDSKWISMGISLPPDVRVDEVIICYRIATESMDPPESSISEIRLKELASADQAADRHIDARFLASTDPDRYSSTVQGLLPAGAVSLWLRLNLPNEQDKILLGAVGLGISGVDCAIDLDAFGAIGDGVTTPERGIQNRVALEKAIAAAVGAGVPLHVPCGRYYIETSATNWIRINGNLVMYGDGRFHSTLLFGPDPLTSSRAAFEIVDDTEVQVEKLELIGPADHRLFTGIGFDVYNSGARLRIRDAVVARFSHPFRCEVGGEIDLDDCYVEHGNIALHGVNYASDSPMCGAVIRARNCRFRYRSVLSFHEGSQALYAGHGTSIDISHCHVESLGQVGENAFQSYGDVDIQMNCDPLKKRTDPTKCGQAPNPSLTFHPAVTRIGLFTFESGSIIVPAEILAGVDKDTLIGSLIAAYNGDNDNDIPIQNNGLLGRVMDVLAPPEAPPDTYCITVDAALKPEGPISCGLRTTARIVRSSGSGSWITEGFKLNMTIGNVSGTLSNNGRNIGRVAGITDERVDVAGGVLVAEGPVNGVTLYGFSQPDFVKYEAVTISDKVSNGFQTNDYCPTTITDCTSSASLIDIFTDNARVIVKGFVSLGAKSCGMIDASALTEGALVQGCDFGGAYGGGCVVLSKKLSTGLMEVVDSNLTNRDHVYGGSGLKITEEATAVNVKVSRSVLSVETAATGVGAAATLFGGGTVDISDSIVSGNGSFGRAIEVTAAWADLTLILNRNKLKSVDVYGSGLMIDCPLAVFKGEVEFNAADHTIVSKSGPWPVGDQLGSFRAGQTIVISGSAKNDGRRGKIHGVDGATIWLLGSALVVDEGPVSHVTITASFIVTVRGAENEFLNPSGYGKPRITGGGIVRGWLAPPDRMGPDLKSREAMTLSPNYAHQHVTGTKTIVTLMLGIVSGGDVDAEYLFGGGRFVLIADGAWALGDTGNIKPRTLASRTVGSAVVLFFDPTEGYWHEEGGEPA